MRRTIAFVVPLVIAVAFGITTARSAGAEEICPDHSGTTIESLHHCVTHAYEMGHIDNGGVVRSLLAKVNAAQAADDRGQTGVAIRDLAAFMLEVDAQAGHHIDVVHAQHMIEHAESVIEALGG